MSHNDEAKAGEYLRQNQVVRPAGIPGPWTLEVLRAELDRIEASGDEAYLERGSNRAGRWGRGRSGVR